MRSRLLALAVLGLVLAACGSDEPAPGPAPGAPGLRAEARGDGRIALRWTPPAGGAASWEVQRRSCAGCPWRTAVRLGPARTGWTDAGVLPGSVPGHRVVSVGPDGTRRASAPTRTEAGGRARLGFVSVADRSAAGPGSLGPAVAWLRRLRDEGAATTVRLDLGADDLRGGGRRWRTIDRSVELAARAGLDAVATVQPRYAGERPWAAASFVEEPTARLATDPGVRDAYVRFTRALVERYGTRGTYWAGAERRGVPRRPVRLWQIGNEPWFDGFGVSDEGSRRYTDLAVRAGRAVHAADPGAAKVLVPTAELLLTSTTVRWARAGLGGGRTARVREVADAFTAHPYPFATPTGDGERPPRMSRCVPREQDEADHARSFCRIRTLRSDLLDLDARGLGELPIWITELGQPTCDPGDGRGWAYADRCIDRAEQARGVADAFALLRRWNADRRRPLRVAGLVWYLDADPLLPAEAARIRDPIVHYGLFGRRAAAPYGDVPKPAWSVWRREAARGIAAR